MNFNASNIMSKGGAVSSQAQIQRPSCSASVGTIVECESDAQLAQGDTSYLLQMPAEIICKILLDRDIRVSDIVRMQRTSKDVKLFVEYHKLIERK